MKKIILSFVMLLAYQAFPALADQGATEERLMFRYRAATEDELNLMRTDRNIKLKAAIVVTKILPGFLTTQNVFKPNDLVLMVNGQPALTPEALEKLMLKFKPEDKIKLSYIDMQAASPNRKSGAMELVKGGVKKTLNYKLAVIETKVEEKPPVSTKPVDTSTPSTSAPTVPAPKVSKPISPPVAKPVEGPKDAKLTPSPDKKWDVAGQTVFDIKGMHIGDILNKEFAYHHCPAKDIEEHVGWVWSDDKQTYVDNGKPSDGNITGSDSFEIDGKSVFVLYTFQNRLLVGVIIVFDTGLYDTIKKVYTDKFKQEPKVSNDTVTTGMGVQYTNETSTWQTSSGPFILNRYGADIKNGSGMLRSPELEKAFNEQEGKAKEALKEKL